MPRAGLGQPLVDGEGFQSFEDLDNDNICNYHMHNMNMLVLVQGLVKGLLLELVLWVGSRLERNIMKNFVKK